MEVLYSVQLRDLEMKSTNRKQDVKILQALLNAWNFNCGKVDGIFGVRTLDALLNFKKKVGLERSDKVNMTVWNKLFNYGGN